MNLQDVQIFNQENKEKKIEFILNKESLLELLSNLQIKEGILKNKEIMYNMLNCDRDDQENEHDI